MASRSEDNHHVLGFSTALATALAMIRTLAPRNHDQQARHLQSADHRESDV